MTRNVIGLFRDTNEAQAAIQDLESAGFSREHLNVIAYDGSAADSEGNELGEEHRERGCGRRSCGPAARTGRDGDPGVGPIIAAGPIVAALAGAGVGAATGGILGALSDMGVPGHEAKYYHEAVRHGGTLIIVPTEAEHIAQDILDRHGAVGPDGGLETRRSPFGRAQLWRRGRVEPVEPCRAYRIRTEAPVTRLSRQTG